MLADVQSWTHAFRAPGPLVGRAEELGRLHAAWQRALKGERELAFLSGEPGIGKTRLAYEFAREVERIGALSIYGSCDEDPVVPYEPFVEVLQRLAAGASPAPEVAGSAQATLVDLVSALSTAAERGSAPDSPTRRLMLFEGVRSVLRAAARSQPLLLVIDDLHWADSDTVRLLRYLARGSWGVPVLLLGTFRDTEHLAADQPLRSTIADLHRDANFEQVEMQPLLECEVQEFAERTLERAVAADDAQRLHEATGGNPFFVQELVAVAAQAGDGPIPRGPPVAAREVIARRLSRLTPTCLQVLMHASILGNAAEPGPLQALWDRDISTLAAGLGEGVKAGLLVEDEGRYRFAHSLIQQALYHDLPLPYRQQLHVRAAQAIEAQRVSHSGDRSVVLATHYRRAGDEARPEDGLPHALAAAKAAVGAFAVEEAIAWWGWALVLEETLGADPPVKARLLERMAGVLDNAREQSRATEYLKRALSIREEAGDPHEIAAAQLRLATAHTNGNLRNTDLASARQLLQAATPALEAALDRYELATLHGVWGLIGVSGFRIADLQHTQECRVLCADFPRHPIATYNEISRGALAYHLGGLDPALPVWDAAWRSALAQASPIESGIAAFMVGISAQRLCDPTPAVEWLRRELEAWPAPGAAAPWGIPSRLVSALAETGDIAAMGALSRKHTERDEERIEVMVERSAFAFVQGIWDGPVWAEAEASAHRALARDDRCSCQNLGHWLVRAYRARGHSETAVAFLEEELSSSLAGGSLAQELVARSELAALLAEAGDVPGALPHLVRCRDIFDGPDDRRALEGKLLLGDALLTTAREGPDAAAVLFTQAIEVFRRYSNPWLEARAFEDWAGVLVKAHRRSKALAKVRQAEAIYRRIGAGQPWLDRLSRIVPSNGSGHGAALPNGLTVREAEVLRLVAAGRTSREIGEQLVLSVRTVERHIANIYLKSDTHSRVQLAAFALSHGLS